MNLLLDTHALIWFLNGDEKLSHKVKGIIEDSNNTKAVSIASIWEIAIKISLDKFRYIKGFRHFLDLIEENGFEILPISFEHVMIVSTLEFIHRDPFDRILISQCQVENLTMLTKDENIQKYNIKTIW
jgi:PIN domain nuclease of toxin-antitoxin system